MERQHEDALRARKMAKVLVGEDRKVPAEIYYKTYGMGEHKIVFVMGLLARADIWEHQIDYFVAKDFQVLVLDNRGCGQSSVPAYRYTTKMLAEDVHEVLLHLSWSQYHVAGCSMGGMISQELALLAPEKVQSLTLLATHTGSGLVSLPPLYGAYITLKNMFVSDTITKQTNSMRILYGEETLEDEVLYDALKKKNIEKERMYGRATFQGFLSQIAAVFTHKVEKERLQQLQHIPTLVVTGTDDQMVRPSNSYEIATVLNTDVIILKGKGHHLAWECPSEINQLVHQLIQKGRQK